MRAFLLVVLVTGCESGKPGKDVDNKAAVALTSPAPSASGALLAWPVAPFTKDQIAEVKRCDLPNAHAAKNPKSACEHATVAEACAKKLKNGDDPSKECLAEYSAAIRANPAFAFAADLPGAFFGKLAIVDVPPAATKPLVAATIHYNWSGMGEGVDWTLTVTDANRRPSVSVTGVTAKAAPADVGKKLATMGSAVQSMLPVAAPLNAVNCYDNYPDWTATLEYEGGGKLELATHRSNLLGLGGPWQLTSGGQTYVQLGPQMVRAMADIMTSLDLPAGEPAAQTCHGYDIEAAVLN
jgi:hypothetical protein